TGDGHDWNGKLGQESSHGVELVTRSPTGEVAFQDDQLRAPGQRFQQPGARAPQGEWFLSGAWLLADRNPRAEAAVADVQVGEGGEPTQHRARWRGQRAKPTNGA